METTNVNPKLSKDLANSLSYGYLNLELLHQSQGNLVEFRKNLIFDSFSYHYGANEKYMKYCDAIFAKNSTSFEEVLSTRETRAIPLLPSSLFKTPNANALSLPAEQIIKYCNSSGTQGNVSSVPRDDVTLNNFMSSINSYLPLLLDIERPGDWHCIVLGPKTQDAGDLWFSYVIASTSTLFPTFYAEKNNTYKKIDVFNHLEKCIESDKNILIIGPPFRIFDLVNSVENMNYNFNFEDTKSDCFVISAGGWKSKNKEKIHPEEFRKAVSESLSIRPENIRDFFNMVELNSVIGENLAHKKIIPPWIEAYAINPTTLEPLEDGEEGVLAFLDASSVSYPCFIMSEDIGFVKDQVFPKGKLKYSQTLHISRRLKSVETRGCALKMSMNTKMSKLNSNRFHLSKYRTV